MLLLLLSTLLYLSSAIIPPSWYPEKLSVRAPTFHTLSLTNFIQPVLFYIGNSTLLAARFFTALEADSELSKIIFVPALFGILGSLFPGMFSLNVN
jgi:hypothetical protein